MAKKIHEAQFKVLIERDEDGVYIASVPELPGCHTQGKTLEITRERIMEAINLYLEAHPKLKEEKKKSSQTVSTFFGVEDIKIHYA